MDPVTVKRHERERLELEIRRRRAGGRQERAPDAIDRGRDPGLVALLENVRSLWNVGSMFRTADGAGVGRLVLTGITGCPPRPGIQKTALGAEEVVPWEYVADPLAAGQRLLEQGFRLLAVETGEEGVPLAEAPVAEPTCIIVGHEVAGLSAQLLDLADVRVALPMRGLKASLNVAVAFGIVAYGLRDARDAMATPRRSEGSSTGSRSAPVRLETTAITR